jgi:CO/xanthine dehydrogenase Mo-binding subunit
MADELIQNKSDKPWLWRSPKDGYIGRRGLRPKEAPEKVTGRAVYTNDVYLPGMLYAKIYRSPYAHARIKSMDSSKAEALPGVWAVIRYDDPDIDLSEPGKASVGILWLWWRNSILPDTADFYGVRVGAMVVAESQEICDRALKLIGEGIVWEELPFILDPEGAAQPDAPLMHPELNPKSNVWKDVVVLNQGDVEKGFAASDNVIEFYESKRDDDVWAGVEPGCMVAQWKGEEVEFWYHGATASDTDMVVMRLPVFKKDVDKTNQLKVHSPYNGGSFGGNTVGYNAHLVRYAAIAAKKTQRPVKLVDDYGMSWEGLSFETGTARYKVGFNNDGNIIAIRIDTYQKTGLPITEKFIDSLKTPNVYVHEIRSYWSKPHEACWKDGATNCTFVNLVINKVAAHLDMDPIKVQLLNDGAEGHDMAWLDENVKKHYGMPARDSLKEVIEKGKAAFDWDKKWHLPGTRKLPNGKMHGVAFYAVCSWMTGNPAITADIFQDKAVTNLDPDSHHVPAGHKDVSGIEPGCPDSNPGIAIFKDGKATIFYHRCDAGQSAPTTYCQIIADEIGLRYDDVNIEFKEYSYFDALPPRGSTGASINSFALVLTARETKKLILTYALQPIVEPDRVFMLPPKITSSPFKGKTIEELDIKNGIIFEKANPENKLPVSKVTASYYTHGGHAGPFFVHTPWLAPPRIRNFFKVARQCCFIEVEVDTETGQVDVTKLVHPYDIGQSLNPDVNEAQLYGGAYQGLGVSCTEALYYDPQTGVKLNDNLIGYPVLTILDVGLPIECPTIETHCGFSAYGLYGCGESGKAVTGAALLVPAVYNAIGKWIEETPVTPDRVLKALGKA